jgi:hypothetical protein
MIVVITTLQATHGGKERFFWRDKKISVLIIKFLNYIQGKARIWESQMFLIAPAGHRTLPEITIRPLNATNSN